MGMAEVWRIKALLERSARIFIGAGMAVEDFEQAVRIGFSAGEAGLLAGLQPSPHLDPLAKAAWEAAGCLLPEARFLTEARAAFLRQLILSRKNAAAE